MQAFYSDRYGIDLPPHHAFPMQKYAAIHARLLADGTLHPSAVHEPRLATREELLRVHTPEYHDRLVAGRLAASEIRRLGLPWSAALVLRARASVGGTLGAASLALAGRVAANLGGGTHHAFADHGEGYCVFNDIAVAIRALQASGHIERAAVVDCDVHHGNGTAAIFAADPRVYTLSLHGARNYPLVKPPSRVDVALPDGTGDAFYDAALERELGRLFESFAPDLVFYQAGVDPYADDRLGRLGLSLAGLRARDERVLCACRDRRVPCVVTLGGGYARVIEDTIEAHCNTLRVAHAVFDSVYSRPALPASSA